MSNPEASDMAPFVIYSKASSLCCSAHPNADTPCWIAAIKRACVAAAPSAWPATCPPAIQP